MAKELLITEYKTVDFFDQCPYSVWKAKEALSKHPRIGQIGKATMEHFEWEHEYSAVYMVWVAGYLGCTALVDFLKKAQA